MTPPGPSGLMAATELMRRGVPVRCVDRAAGPGDRSRALAVWPRTAELLDRLGPAPRGPLVPQSSLRYYSSGRTIADIGFRSHPETRPSVYPQPGVERRLRDRLADAGGSVEWGLRLEGLQQDTAGVEVVLRGADGSLERQRFAYVVGADGAGSPVRTALGVPFEGSTHELGFVVADVTMSGDLQPDVTHYFCSPRGILVTCGLPGGRFRVFTSGPPGLDRDAVDLGVVQQLVDERGPGGLTLGDPEWISVFAVHSRHASRTRVGRVVLVGDAAHVHSPAGGQGLNTGIGDAHNLAWKLALVWHGRCPPDLLDTYEAERGQVARAVIRQARLQTRMWLIRGRWQVALRDGALRVASALRLFHVGYVPWLAGLRTRYDLPSRSRRPVAGYRAGALLPATPVRTGAGSRPLRLAVTDLRHTVLVDAVGGLDRSTRDLLEGLRRGHPDTVEVRVLDGGRLGQPGELPAPTGRGVVRAVVLARPDGHVDLASRDPEAVVARTAELFAPFGADTVRPAAYAPVQK